MGKEEVPDSLLRPGIDDPNRCGRGRRGSPLRAWQPAADSLQAACKLHIARGVDEVMSSSMLGSCLQACLLPGASCHAHRPPRMPPLPCSRGCSMRGRFERMIRGIQDQVCAAIEEVDGCNFRQDAWTRPSGGGGITRVLQVRPSLIVFQHVICWGGLVGRSRA